LIVGPDAVGSAGLRCDFTPDSSRLVITFGGLPGRQLAHGSFAEEPGAAFEFAQSLRRVPVKKMFVRDHAAAWYHRGVRDAGPDIDSVAAYLRGLVADAAVDDVVLIGNSAGGYAALLFGALLGGEVHAFSPQTFIDPKLRERHGDNRWSGFIEAIGDRMDSRYADLVPVLETGTGRFHVYYPSAGPDVIHAERLDHLHQVALHQIECGGHALVRRLRRSGWLQAFVDSVGTGTAIPSAPRTVQNVGRRAGPGPDSTSGAFCDLEPDSPVLVVTFGGRAGGPGPLANALDESVPVKTVRVVDHERAWYHRGVRGVGADVDAVAQWLHEVSAGADRVVMLGASAGGYGALLFGALLGAEVHAFSPETSVKGGDHRYADLRPVLAAGGGDLHIYYAANVAAETAHAERIAGLPNVTLHPLQDPGQGLFKSLQKDGWVRSLMHALAAGTEILAPAPGPQEDPGSRPPRAVGRA
jgi:hypothetical protein